MDPRSQIREFLVSRRARITPQQAGLHVPQHGRRVPGLRREEVAALAGVSVEYYNRLERGALGGASDSVLDAVARTLRLDEVERAHLFDLARATQPASGRRRSRPAPPAAVTPQVQAVLDALVGAPALVRSSTLDVVAMNDLGRTLYSPLYENPRRPANLARFTFLDSRARDFWVDWEQVADDFVGHLQATAGRDPHDRSLTELVGELSTCSEDFRVAWARHDVRAHGRGIKRMNHPIVGRVDVGYEVLQLPAEPGLTFVVYTAEAGTPSHDALSMLATWTATQHQEDKASGSVAGSTPQRP